MNNSFLEYERMEKRILNKYLDYCIDVNYLFTEYDNYKCKDKFKVIIDDIIFRDRLDKKELNLVLGLENMIHNLKESLDSDERKLYEIYYEVISKSKDNCLLFGISK